MATVPPGCCATHLAAAAALKVCPCPSYQKTVRSCKLDFVGTAIAAVAGSSNAPSAPTCLHRRDPSASAPPRGRAAGRRGRVTHSPRAASARSKGPSAGHKRSRGSGAEQASRVVDGDLRVDLALASALQVRIVAAICGHAARGSALYEQVVWDARRWHR